MSLRVVKRPPTLAELATEPAKASELREEQIPALLTQLATVHSVIAARLLTLQQAAEGAPAEGSGLVRIAEAAKLLGTSPDWLYRHADDYPFTRRLSSRQLRFDLAGLQRYLRQRRPAA